MESRESTTKTTFNSAMQRGKRTASQMTRDSGASRNSSVDSSDFSSRSNSPFGSPRSNNSSKLSPRQQLTKSKFMEIKKKLVCEHYQSNAEMKCETCKRFFPCRFCHDLTISEEADNYTHKGCCNDLTKHVCEFNK